MILLRYFQNKHINAKHTQPLFQSNFSVFPPRTFHPPSVTSSRNNDPSCNNSNNAPISLNWPMHRFTYIDLPSFPPLDLHWIASKPIPLDFNYEISPLIQCVTVPCADYDPRRLRKCHGREIKISFHVVHDIFHNSGIFLIAFFSSRYPSKFFVIKFYIYIDNFHRLKIKKYYTHDDDNKLRKIEKNINRGSSSEKYYYFIDFCMK